MNICEKYTIFPQIFQLLILSLLEAYNFMTVNILHPCLKQGVQLMQLIRLKQHYIICKHEVFPQIFQSLIFR